MNLSVCGLSVLCLYVNDASRVLFHLSFFKAYSIAGKMVKSIKEKIIWAIKSDLRLY